MRTIFFKGFKAAFAIFVLSFLGSCGVKSPYDRIEATGSERYAIVYKDSCCALYDLEKKEQLTELEYDSMSLRNRDADTEVGAISVFVFNKDGHTGMLSVAEENNEIMTITFPD